jgi:DNA-binding NarL/FixJ family response regulator
VGTAAPVLLVDTAASAAGDRGAIEAVEQALTLVVAETDVTVFLTAQDPVAAIAQSVAAVAAAVATAAESMPRCSPRLFGPLLRAVRRHCAALPLQEVSGNKGGVRLPSPTGSAVTSPSRAGLLTPREVEVARLIAFEGLTDTEIGERLGVSVNTVRTHVAGLRRKLNVSARGKIAAALRRHLY